MVKKILIVDDEEDFAVFIEKMIKSLKFEVFIANNGESALDLLRKEKFDLVLLDIMMPDMSGIDVLKKIRASFELKNLKVAFLSVIQLSPEGKSSIKKLKPSEYFQKPIIDLDDFKRRLKKILN